MQIYVSSRVSPMRGTIAFERLNCTAGGHPRQPGQGGTYVRIRLNDAVYRECSFVLSPSPQQCAILAILYCLFNSAIQVWTTD